MATSAAASSAVLSPKVHPERVETGLAADYRKAMAGRLSEILAATYRLTIKSHLYHWNVVGPLFKPLHDLTEEHYGLLFAATDIVAERIRALGHLAPSDMATVAGFAPEVTDLSNLSAEAMVDDLIADHEACVRSMREAAEMADEGEDVVTADMLTDRLAFHEKVVWMLRAIVSR